MEEVGTKQLVQVHIGKYFVQKISRLREELDQGYVPNDRSYVLDTQALTEVL